MKKVLVFAIFLLSLSLLLLSTRSTPAASTTPSYFGYFYAAKSIDKVKDHSNVMFARSMDDFMKIMNTSSLKVIYDMTWELWNPVNGGADRWVPLSNWQDKWKSEWQQMKPYANRIAAIYPIDEPDYNSNYTNYINIADTITATTKADGFSIPIAAVITPQAVWAITDYKNAQKGPNYGVNSSWVKSNKFTVPGDHIDWIGTSEYGCWDKTCVGNIKLSKKFDNLISTFSKFSRLKKLIVVADGYLAGNKTPSTSDQNTLVKINQNIYNYCKGNSKCVAMLPFLYESDFKNNLVGLDSMPIVAADLQKTADVILKALK